MDVIYYYCYLFYKKILKEDEPHATTVWAFGFGEGYFISIIFDMVVTKYFCYDIIEYCMFPIIGLSLLFNYLYFSRSKRSQKIVKEKPTFFGSHKASIILTSIFFFILISSMFWGPFCSKYMLDTYCR